MAFKGLFSYRQVLNNQKPVPSKYFLVHSKHNFVKVSLFKWLKNMFKHWPNPEEHYNNL